MLLYCLRYGANTESENSKVSKINNRKKYFFHQNEQCLIVKNHDLTKKDL